VSFKCAMSVSFLRFYKNAVCRQTAVTDLQIFLAEARKDFGEGVCPQMELFCLISNFVFPDDTKGTLNTSKSQFLIVYSGNRLKDRGAVFRLPAEARDSPLLQNVQRISAVRPAHTQRENGSIFPRGRTARARI
jgi:hypothetical protein